MHTRTLTHRTHNVSQPQRQYQW